MEASYPSSTTLLVLSVMPTVVLQSRKRVKNDIIKMIITIVTIAFSLFMVVGRLISGVHWFTDIVGAIILSAGLFLIYKGGVTIWNSTKSFRN
jgi:undecaprenyl-diphosphatase